MTLAHPSSPSDTSSAGATAPVGGGRIQIRDVSIVLGGNSIVQDVSLDIASGEFVCLLGPSGCGKSTLLNALAGFQGLAGGVISVNDEPLLGPSIDRGIVFQSSEALFPWLTVRQNVEYGPRMRGTDSAERRRRSQHYLELVGLAHVDGHLPSELSGGMRQRVQIARVLANEPSIVLMDEPFGALDAQTRHIMQSEINRIWRATRPTVVFVTHDISEALLLADRIVIMTAGPAAGFKSIESIDMPHPRDLTEPQAVALLRRMRDAIGEEVTKALQAQGLDAGVRS